MRFNFRRKRQFAKKTQGTVRYLLGCCRKQDYLMILAFCIFPALLILLKEWCFASFWLFEPLQVTLISGWESSITEMQWSSVIATTLVCVLSAASSCLSWTLRLVWRSPTVTSGWRRDTEVQVSNCLMNCLFV